MIGATAQETRRIGLQIRRPQVRQYKLSADGPGARALREGRVDMLEACLVALGRDKGWERRQLRGKS